jgi:hypothetical protein
MYSPLIKPKPGFMINPLHPLSNGLVCSYLCNEGHGRLANDISGKGNHGILRNISQNSQSSGWCSSKLGGSLQLDGINDDSLLLTTKASFSFWLKPNNVTGLYIGLIGRTDSPLYNYIVRISNGVLELRAWNGTADTVASDTAIIEVNKWQYITVVVDLPDVHFYKNGILIKSDTPTFTSLDDGGVTDTNIGVYRYSGGVYYNGVIDLINIYNRSLNIKEVEMLYRNPFCNILTVPISRYYVAPTGGWTGIINGITNPSYINGIAVANIEKVNGVA